MRQNILAQFGIGDVCTERKHADERARPGSNGKRKRVERAFLKMPCIHHISRLGFLLLILRIRGIAFLIQQAPCHRRDDDAAGELDNWQRDAEEFEDGRARQLDRREEDDVIDGNFARQRANEIRGRIAHQRKKDQGRAERIDQWQQHAEGNQE